MGILDPAPRLRPTLETSAEIDALSTALDDPYAAGQRNALLWVLTGASHAPGSGQQWVTSAPTAQHVAAEHHFVVGRLYESNDDQDRLSGADEALLGR